MDRRTLSDLDYGNCSQFTKYFFRDLERKKQILANLKVKSSKDLGPLDRVIRRKVVKPKSSDNFPFEKLYNSYKEDYYGLSEKSVKRIRTEDFKNEWLDILKMMCKYVTEKHGNYCVIIELKNKRKFTYYYGKDRLQIHKGNKWKDEGLKYILTAMK